METVILRTYIFVFLNSHSNLTMWVYVCWQHFNGRNENDKNYKTLNKLKIIMLKGTEILFSSLCTFNSPKFALKVFQNRKKNPQIVFE